MSKPWIVALITCSVFAICTSLIAAEDKPIATQAKPEAKSDQPDRKSFVDLFNGKDLTGWTIVGDPAGFFVKDGVIRSELPYKGEWLRSNKQYRDFILRVEWRVSKDGNSGVFVRAAKEGYPWVTGSEVQITNAPRDDAHCTGSLYGSVAVKPRPDESHDVWHTFEIHCIGTKYKVIADNVTVVDVDAQDVPALLARPLEGYIGVQDNHSEADGAYVEYRSIRIKELNAKDQDETGWLLGTQAYTFNRFTFFEAVSKAQELGLKYIEAYPGQPDIIDQVKKYMADAGVRMYAYGVVHLTNDEAKCREVFEFAKTMGAKVITAEPDPNAFDLLDKLTLEYDIKVAIHNYPVPSRYYHPERVLTAIEGHSDRIGACADTGHWIRSGVDPVEALKMLEGRIISLHFKDLHEKGMAGHDTIWGTGVGDVKAMLAELHRQNFAGLFSVEYEYNWDNSVPDIAKSLKYFRQVEKELGR